MFREALSYPTRKPDGPRSVLIGGGLVFLTSLFGLAAGLAGRLDLVALLGLLPYLALRGYYVRVVRTTIGRDRPTPPAIDDARRLLRDGLGSLFISVVYLLPGVVVIAPLAYARAVGTDAGTVYADLGLPTAIANAALSATGVLALIAAMYLIGALYATPVAVARFAYEDRLRAAFDLRSVVDGALSEDYAVAWAISLLLQVLFLVAYLLRFALVGFFLHFVVAVGVRYTYGQGVGNAMALDPVVPDRSRTDRATGTPGDSHTPRPPDPGEDPMLGAHDGANGGAAAPTDEDPGRGDGRDSSGPNGEEPSERDGPETSGRAAENRSDREGERT